ncbi:MAG: Hpt domain-containing protein [Bdellovibrionota bacterium]
MFITNSPTIIDEIREASQVGDAKRVESLAHKLKGGAKNLGATIMAEDCAALEELGEKNDLRESDKMVFRISSDFKNVVSLLKKKYKDETKDVAIDF